MMKAKWISLFLILCSTVCFATENLKVLIPSNVIAKRIKIAASQINKEYRNQPLTVIMVMKGAIFVTADLLRNLHVPYTLEYIQAKSLGITRGSPEARVELTGIENLNVTGKHVLIVDDIFDSGKTILAIIKSLEAKNPKSIKSLVVFAKQVQRKTSYLPDYSLLDNKEVMAKFPDGEDKNRVVVGYGIDYKEQFRGLPGLYVYSAPQ